MKFKDRVPKELFREDGHYLGRPADFEDRIIKRRIKLVEQVPNFTGSDLTLLEIGCGNGASIFSLASKMKYCLGIEITNEHLDQFESYKKNNAVVNCDYQIVDVTKDNPPALFDRIISFEVIEHLESEDNGLNFYYNALKINGLIAISVPNKWWIFETHGANLPLLPWNRVPFFSWLPKSIHEKFSNARIYTPNRIKTLLEKHGFEIINCKYITAPMDVLPNGKFKDFIINNFFNTETTQIPFKATSIFVAAKKI
jgi:2-polyprenyl-3-methyl-5-hydroxy-6-metoxy-1,4-benzoquinol methylase